jgi:NAD(P)-dependent dehydrogenase (short-subunit alcohol dehydrogenase family)
MAHLFRSAAKAIAGADASDQATSVADGKNNRLLLSLGMGLGPEGLRARGSQRRLHALKLCVGQPRRLASPRILSDGFSRMAQVFMTALSTIDRTHERDLGGRVALVTGASRGIGRATALALANAGARVIVHYGNSVKDANSLVAEIREAGGQADAVQADLSAPDGAHKLAGEVGKLVGGKLDILVANAGIAVPASIEAQTVEDFDRMFAVNVRAPFFLVQQLLPLMTEGSNIVMTSSLAARAAVGQLPAYSATKGAIDTLVKHFASLLGPRGIRVNAVAPGIIDTDMSEFSKTEEGRTYALGIQALQRIGHADDVAEVVAFLASDSARWVTGDTVQVGGGSKL